MLFVITLALSGCAVQKVKVDDIKPDSSIKLQLPLDGSIAIYIPFKESEEKVMVQEYGRQWILNSGEALRKASKDVAARYFQDAGYFSLDKKAHFMMKVEGQAELDTYWGSYKTDVNISLYSIDGKLIDTRKVSGSVISSVINDENAFYNSYVGVMNSYFDELFKERGELLSSYAKDNDVNQYSRDKIHEAIELVGTGTGFVVNHLGNIVTNYHVVENCLSIAINEDGRESGLELLASDKKNDIAILSSNKEKKDFAVLLSPLRVGRLGEEVIALGYPLHGVLSGNPNLTTGNISALAGIGGDTSVLQISAPVQPGNSGSPLINRKGLVIGVVQSKLNVIKLAQYTGDIAQNINFAVKIKKVIELLDKNSIEYHKSDALKLDAMSIPDIAEKAEKYTVQVMCHG